MTDFFRFPHTPHLCWLGKGSPRDDKVLSASTADDLLSGEVVVEEKLDGANLGISIGSSGQLKAQNRGQYLQEPYAGQFSRLNSWLAQHQWALKDHLSSNCILFGEWCAAKHSLDYNCLPDWLMVFDVYDRHQRRFWSVQRRNELAQTLGIAHVPALYKGKISPAKLNELLNATQSRYRSGPPEGLIIREDRHEWCVRRAKLVRAEFTQAIDDHWRGRSIEWNKIK
ncbi:RNA ligase family protein [Microbulbifer sp. SA54]|uniref:RNA ligase family protein n=1 Tax=Microbulbifer sp. SA54 TaxID=3401577 RepID=UPI003AAC5F75